MIAVVSALSLCGPRTSAPGCRSLNQFDTPNGVRPTRWLSFDLIRHHSTELRLHLFLIHCLQPHLSGIPYQLACLGHHVIACAIINRGGSRLVFEIGGDVLDCPSPVSPGPFSVADQNRQPPPNLDSQSLGGLLQPCQILGNIGKRLPGTDVFPIIIIKSAIKEGPHLWSIPVGTRSIPQVRIRWCRNLGYDAQRHEVGGVHAIRGPTVAANCTESNCPLRIFKYVLSCAGGIAVSQFPGVQIQLERPITSIAKLLPLHHEVAHTKIEQRRAKRTSELGIFSFSMPCPQT